MLIDWFTVVAQLVNFLILIWLLKRFLYQPVLKALDEREIKIATELEHAASVEAEASREKAEWQKKNDEFAQQRQQMMKQATDEATTRRSELLDEARQEYDALHSRLLETLKREEAERQEEAERRVSDEIFSVAGKLLTELADESLESRIIDKFCRKLEAGGPEIAGQLEGQNGAAKQAIVRSTFPLTPEQREKVSGTITTLLGVETPLSFEQSDKAGCGIELCVDGLCISWHFQAALDALKRAADEYRDRETDNGAADAR
ncbi:alternate F1F0 ATPase, F0 subunit B [Chlorobaculum parvum NCIB 8327]|uniref:ATP synthase subunit b n=1 Tax=Chlorobaculum parvum (strain DSM 263 / NCIMB 8327) TaxID=517417 RepID=B3QNH5_CHLP8|nr:F1F0 ATPase F0 subunit B [Chlorobaculum parvum]ACF11478.1 alternate F1F0 ATPase, F0 subunit B [Chlorobaculum parvum NCIB 8327]